MLKILGTEVSTGQFLGGLLVFYLGYIATKRIYYDARIRKLGARAPTRTTYLPMGLDMAYAIINSALADKVYEWWLAMYAKYSPGHYTVEAGVGERVILTAEPENIKAILATQFKDYGKGEQFHKDWYHFLGDGGHF